MYLVCEQLCTTRYTGWFGNVCEQLCPTRYTGWVDNICEQLCPNRYTGWVDNICEQLCPNRYTGSVVCLQSCSLSILLLSKRFFSLNSIYFQISIYTWQHTSIQIHRKWIRKQVTSNLYKFFYKRFFIMSFSLFKRVPVHII